MPRCVFNYVQNCHIGICQCERFNYLDCSLLLYSELASVITTRTANGVINVPLTTVWADCQCRSYCLVMSSSLGSSSLWLSSFRMCHFSNFLIIFFFNYLLLSANSWDRPNADQSPVPQHRHPPLRLLPTTLNSSPRTQQRTTLLGTSTKS